MSFTGDVSGFELAFLLFCVLPVTGSLSPFDTHHSDDRFSLKTLQLQTNALFSLSARYGEVIHGGAAVGLIC